MERRFRKPYRIKKKRYWYKNKAMWLMVIALALIVLFVYLVWFWTFLQVNEIEVIGNDSISKERVVAITRENISQKILGLRSSTILFVDESAISEVLQNWFPSIEFVSVQKSFPAKIAVTIFLRQKIISWCEFVENNEECVAVDRFGVAFKSTSFTNPYITGPSELTMVSFGNEVINPDFLSQLLAFQTEVESWSVLKQDEVTVLEFAIISENRVHIILSELWAVYINPKENLDWQLTKFKLVLERKISQERRGELLYLDLRFGDQALVKYMDE